MREITPAVLHTEASSGFGGQEVRILAETTWLRRRGWEVAIACQPGSPLAVEARRAGLDVHPIPMRHALDVSAFAALRWLVRERRIAVVHTHSSIDSWLGALAAKSLGRPVVRSRHVSIPVRRRRALVYHLADRIVTSGDTIKAILVAVGVRRDKIVSLPAGVDTARFHPGVSGAAVRAELGLAPDVKLVGLVANIRGSKGHRDFIRAARDVLRAAPRTRFVIVGDGVGFADVRRQVREAELEAAVTLTGFRRDIPEVMAALDLLVLPSVKSEATSQVIPQALAVGTPVVATTVGGIPEIVRDGETGFLVPPGDPGALAATILAVLGDEARARATARAGQAWVHARLTFDGMMARMIEVYRELAAPRRA